MAVPKSAKDLVPIFTPAQAPLLLLLIYTYMTNSDQIFAGGQLRAVLTIPPIDVAASSTDVSIIAAPTAGYIRILTLAVQVGGTATQVQVKSKVGAAAATNLSPAWEFGANGGIVISPSNTQAVKDAANLAAVTVTTGTGATTHISGTYIVIA